MAYTKNATDKVYNFIQNKMEAGEWKTGDRIWTEAKLQKELEVSRVAVRQAIDKMIIQSRLYSIQGSGTYVQSTRNSEELNLGLNIDAEYEELLDILEFRKYYECGTVALCIEYGTEEDIREIEKYYEIMKQCGEDMEAFYTADYNFHDAIAKGTKKKFIFRISNSLSKILLHNQEKLNFMIGPEVGLEYHAFILKYIKERDVELATLYMQKHMEASIQALRTQIRRNREGRK
jgi:GntR family transcriptional repressor for pyruvate dehydrogenase complex